ncbi:Hypothetical protein A7982_04199 [Minicystis rosea]|nr:Hypothetical protein A7982_04199 [Minicystis rosea]
MADLEDARRRVALELPRNVKWCIRGTSLDFDFTRAERALAPLREAEINGSIEPEWASLFLFGEQDFAEGGGARPFVGIERNTGQVLGLDVERDFSCLFLYNSDLDSFIRTFKLFDEALRSDTPPLDTLSTRAACIDVAFAQSEWALLLGYLANG